MLSRYLEILVVCLVRVHHDAVKHSRDVSQALEHVFRLLCVETRKPRAVRPGALGDYVAALTAAPMIQPNLSTAVLVFAVIGVEAISYLCRPSCSYSLLKLIEVAEMYIAALDLYLGLPLAVCLPPANANCA